MPNPNTLEQFMNAAQETEEQNNAATAQDVVGARTVTLEDMSKKIVRDVLLRKLNRAGFKITPYEEGNASLVGMQKVTIDDGENIRIIDAA